MVEREVKLHFQTPEEARAAVLATRASLLRPRRLQHDILFDTADQQLRQQGCALRLRHEDGAGIVTFKGPATTGTMKVREEHETGVGDVDAMRLVLEGIGFRAWFTYEKYREEYSVAGVVIAIDETPIGTFVELEGDEAGILEAARLLQRSPSQFIVASYRSLFVDRCAQPDAAGDMVFTA